MINKTLFISLFVPLLFYSCKERHQHSTASFLDVDILTLKGIGMLKGNEYPNIEITDLDSLKTLTYHVDESHSFVRTYRHEGECWVTDFQYKDDTAIIYTKRVIYPKVLVEYSYTDSIKHQLLDVGVLVKDTMTFYQPKRRFGIPSQLGSIDRVKRDIASEIIYRYDTIGISARIIKQIKMDKLELSDVGTKCFAKNGRSFFWWLEFQDYIKEMPCR
ncbi:MAG: hypothetical protein DI535_23165 [Citrobacter freundii]|nr:MAG: hypothetical protein DI535_23165 [Citrobacter freundii]